MFTFIICALVCMCVNLYTSMYISAYNINNIILKSTFESLPHFLSAWRLHFNSNSSLTCCWSCCCCSSHFKLIRQCDVSMYARVLSWRIYYILNRWWVIGWGQTPVRKCERKRVASSGDCSLTYTHTCTCDGYIWWP